MKFLFIKKALQKGYGHLEFITFEENVADIFSKAMTKLRLKIHIISPGGTQI